MKVKKANVLISVIRLTIFIFAFDWSYFADKIKPMMPDDIIVDVHRHLLILILITIAVLCAVDIANQDKDYLGS